MKISFKDWLNEDMAIGGQPINPADDPTKNPVLKNAANQAIAAAQNALKKGQSPLKVAQSSILQQVQNGKLPLNKMGKVIPSSSSDEVKPM